MKSVMKAIVWGFMALWLSVGLAGCRVQGDEMERKVVLYQGRPTPMGSMSRELLMGIYGKREYQGKSATEVIAGFAIDPKRWETEPVILVKNKNLRELLHVREKYAKFEDFFDENGQYKLPKIWQATLRKEQEGKNLEGLKKAILNADEKIALLAAIERGEGIQPLQQAKVSEYKITAELLYGRHPYELWLFVVSLMGGFVVGLYPRIKTELRCILPIGVGICIAMLLCVREYILGELPLTSGREVMELLAVMLCCVVAMLSRKKMGRIAVGVGMGMVGFVLLTAYLSGKTPQLTTTMPVLHSPWLCIHVSTAMGAYALLSLGSAIALVGCIGKRMNLVQGVRILVEWGCVVLGVAIITGSIWAEVSWGRLWGWDPKEVWSLATLMLYGIGVHPQWVEWKSGRCWLGYMAGIGCVLLFTFYGVNVLMSGMHSYS